MKQCIAVLLTAALCLTAVVFLLASPNEMLSQEQVDALRENYPFCDNIPATIDVIIPTLEKTIQRVDTVVYATVLGGLDRYTIDLEYGGFISPTTYYGYTLKIISDTEQLYKENDIIAVVNNTVFQSTDPALEEGMRVIVPVGQINGFGEYPGYIGFTKYGLYYVTDDGYALSAVSEITANQRSGMRVDSLMKALHQLKEQQEAS